MHPINILVIIAATVVSILIGFIWYSSYGFGNLWGKSTKLKVNWENMQLYLVPTISFLILNTIYAYLLSALNLNSWLDTAILGFFLWAGFSAAAVYTSNVFQQKHFKVFLIDAGYMLICILLSSILLTVL